MIQATDKGKAIATVIPAASMSEHEQAELEHRIALSYNILAEIPPGDLEAIANSFSPINALSRWLDQRKRSSAH